MNQTQQTNKKSFLLYADQKEVFEKLSGDECKELVLAIFDTVNGKTVNSTNRIIDLTLTPIKSQLLRDQEKWEGIRKERAIAGSKGGKARVSKIRQLQANQAIATFDKQIKQSQANQAVTVNVTDNVINKEKDNTPRLDFDKLAVKSLQIKTYGR